jgi:hypothetical protein
MDRSAFDTPWKAILESHFQAFMEICHPQAAQAIDWSKGYTSLDKELSVITQGATIGKRLVDKLMKVWHCNGEETWVLLPTEVQGQAEKGFAERMFIYHYRLYDRYKKPLTSIALLIDENSNWRPSRYEHRLWGCQQRFAAKLI